MRPKVLGTKHLNRVSPTAEVFQFRTVPFRLEPEWQFDDMDVVHTCAKVDVARVRGVIWGYLGLSGALWSYLELQLQPQEL